MTGKTEALSYPVSSWDRNELRSRGLGLGMVRRVLRIGFEEYRLHRTELAVYCHNAGAIRCYEKAGFQKEGIARDRTCFGSDYWSEYRMSILEGEWRAQQAVLNPSTSDSPL